MDAREPVSAWWYVGGGFLLGLAVGLLISPEAVRYRALSQKMRLERPSRPGLVSRVLGWMPLRVKLAGAYGAVTGAGRKAYQLARESRNAAA